MLRIGEIMIAIEKITQLNEWINQANRITVLTGAGVSTPSGIPDFRSSNGIWTKMTKSAEILALPYFNRHPEHFWEIYKEVFQVKLSGAHKPNEIHQFLAQLEKLGKDIDIFTQNVDGLHQLAGSSRVFEMHGSIKSAICPACQTVYDLTYLLENKLPQCNHGILRRKTCNTFLPVDPSSSKTICYSCDTVHDVEPGTASLRCKTKKEWIQDCRRILKPDVVLFGEKVSHYDSAIKSIRNTDLFLVLGTSLEVYPVNQLPSIAQNASCRSVLITREPTELDNQFNLVFHQGISEIFNILNK